jgi:mannose-6-phosphate isomerase-like protein (cupin superfamily)
VLSHIAEALRCSISDLLGDVEKVGPRITNATARKRIVDPESGIERVTLSDELLEQGIDVILYRLPAGTDIGPFAPPRGCVREHLVVVRGKVEVHLDGDVALLGVDDSISYSADVEHRYRNAGRARRSCSS